MNETQSLLRSPNSFCQTLRDNRSTVCLVALAIIVTIVATVLAIHYHGTARYSIIAAGVAVDFILLLLNCRSSEKENPLTSEPVTYRTEDFGRLSNASTIGSSLSISIETLKTIGYKDFVDRFGTTPFTNGRINLNDSGYQNAFVDYVKKEKEISKFFASKYYGDFIYNYTVSLTDYYKDVVDAIKIFKAEHDKGLNVNGKWNSFLRFKCLIPTTDHHSV